MSTECSQEFICVWKIQNFSLSFQKNGEKIESSVFRVECIGGSKWSLEIYPRGCNKDSEGYVSLFLRQKNPSVYNEESIIKYTLSIGTDKKNFGTKTVEDRSYKVIKSWGLPRFESTDKVMEELRNSTEDILTIRCHMFSKCGQDKSPTYETYTDIGVNFTSFSWKVKIADDTVRKNFTVNNKFNYEMTLSGATDSVNICIIQFETILPTFIACKLSLLNSKGKKICSKSAQHLFESINKSEVWEFPSFISKTAIESDTNVLTEDNMIFLLCELAVSDGTVSTKDLDSKDSLNSDVDVSLLQKELKCMLLNDVHSDIILKVNDEEVHAHKSVLAARSPIFSAMFEQDMIESQTGVVHIVDVETDTLKLLLEFIYTATVDNMDYGTAKKLLFAADKYQVLSLREKCASRLESVMSLSNVCDILLTAHMVNHERLKHIAMNFSIENSAEIFNTPDWFSLVEENVKLANEIFSNISTSFNVSPKTKAPVE